MLIEEVIANLEAERDKLDVAIDALRALLPPTGAPKPQAIAAPPAGKGRRPGTYSKQKCPKCGEDVAYLKSHMERYCPKRHLTSESERMDKVRAANGMAHKSFRCPPCNNLEFDSKIALELHQEDVHGIIISRHL